MTPERAREIAEACRTAATNTPEAKRMPIQLSFVEMADLAEYWLDHQCSHVYLSIGPPFEDTAADGKITTLQTVYCQHCKEHDTIPIAVAKPRSQEGWR